MADKSKTIEGRAELIRYLEAGSKPAADWRIGTEHEKFGYRREDFSPIPYEGDRGVHALLTGLTEFGWTPKLEDGKPILLTKGKASVSLEPAGQFELSGAPLETIHQTCDEVHAHMRQVKLVAEPLNIGFIGLGYDPIHSHDDMPLMPKARYGIMKSYMPKVGSHGLDMMFRTCTIQVNLDFANEADMIKKFRVSLALQPIATALFANSPFRHGKPNGYKSYRSYVWRDTDPDRCGMLPFVFEDGMGFERYVDYLLDVPMYFVYRGGKYVDASGLSFRDFMAGKLPALPGELPTMADFEDHMSTVFPEVRMKQFLEMRGADGGPWSRLCALPALWVGLLYDQTALDAAWDLVKDWTREERDQLRHDVPEHALATPFRDTTVQEISRQVLDIASAGLKSRAQLNTMGESEAGFLSGLHVTADSGKTPADRLLDLYRTDWNGELARIYEEFSY